MFKRCPDPLTFLDGTKATSKADWACRRKEVSLLAAVEYWNKLVDRFLKGQSVSTADLFTESFTFDAAKWQDGDIPTLN
ncbi:hypothetical protein WME73_03655 [Sorangium sp. So ce302]|uniref:hypothetical protein n=1 Tax=Sorangium sp. So ce302 TaxID=3133297 RepID=UPI003F603D93